MYTVVHIIYANALGDSILGVINMHLLHNAYDSDIK